MNQIHIPALQARVEITLFHLSTICYSAGGQPILIDRKKDYKYHLRLRTAPPTYLVQSRSLNKLQADLYPPEDQCYLPTSGIRGKRMGERLYQLELAFYLWLLSLRTKCIKLTATSRYKQRGTSGYGQLLATGMPGKRIYR